MGDAHLEPAQSRRAFALAALAEGQSEVMQAVSGRRNAIHEVRVSVV
ncbi:hypothetical protein [Paludibaculum fermentans]